MTGVNLKRIESGAIDDLAALLPNERRLMERLGMDSVPAVAGHEHG
jgi:hypothetical protein